MSPRSFAAFLNEVKSDDTFARDLKRALASANKNEIPRVVAELANRKGFELDPESLKASINIASPPDFSDEEIEIVKGPIMATFWLLSCDCNCYSKTPNSYDNPAC